MVNFYRKSLFVLFTMVFFLACNSTPEEKKETLKEAFKDKFLIGTALNEAQITGKDTASIRIVKEQFSAIVAENCMKSAELHPQEDVYDFKLADQFVEFGVKNGIVVTGHTLIWHSQLPRWFCVDEKGENVTPEVLKKHMKEHIYTVVTRYKGKVKGWDVVNEAIEDDGSYRKSKFYEILGEEFIPLAFQYAHEADPDMELYYNDYSMAIPAKRDGVVRMVNKLKERGIRIDGVGMQGHVGMDNPSLEEFENSIRAFAATGVKVMITEFDLSVLPFPSRRMSADISTNFEYQEKLNPYTNGLPEEVEKEWSNKMMDYFKLFLKYEDVITRVTLWGVTDGDSWKNGFPVRGRTDYPLLFDRNYQAKPVVKQLIQEAQNYK